MAPILQTQKGKRILQQCKILFPFCDPAGIQTQDLQNRNLTLYSAKLRSHVSGYKDKAISAIGQTDWEIVGTRHRSFRQFPAVSGGKFAEISRKFRGNLSSEAGRTGRRQA